MYTCYGCKESLADNEVSQGMNLPDVTPGPVYFCYKCVPVPNDPQEIIDMLENFINPPKERDADG